MNQKTTPPGTKPTPSPTTLMQDQAAQKHKAEEKEVAGKHKNDGQKDHKGSR